MHPRIEYTEGDTWKPLPDWASFLWQLGARMARWSSPDRRAVCVLSVPTREFVAPLVTAGYLAYRSVVAQFADEEAFPTGSTILFEADGGQWYLGRIMERRHHDRLGPSFVIKIAQNNSRIISTMKASRFVRSTETFDPDGRSRPASPRTSIVPTDLCHALLSGGAPVYLRNERPRCVVVGPLTILEAECNTPIWRVPDAGASPGALNELLRVQGLLGPHEPWHTRILSSRVALDDNSSPDFVILDGTAALTRGRTYFESSDQVFVLDRSSTTADEALRIVQEDLLSRDPDVSDDDSLKPPVGVTYVLFFRLRRR